MTKNADHIRPERFASYERRFDAYIKSIGSSSARFAPLEALEAGTGEGRRVGAVVRSRATESALWLRTMPDRLIAHPERGEMYVEVKAYERDNVALEAVQFFFNLRAELQGRPVVYVLVPPRGPFLMVSPRQIAARERVIRMSPGSAVNEVCLRLRDSLGCAHWTVHESTPAVGVSDPFILVYAREVMTWRCLHDSADTPPIEEM